MTAGAIASGTRADLDAALIAAHGRADHRALVGFYAAAATAEEAGGRLDAACFYLTQAYVFALDAGDTRANALRERLRSRGREH